MLDKPATTTEQQELDELQPQSPINSIIHESRFSSTVISSERRYVSNTVFHVDDTPFQSTTSSATHWSVAWSDLMMTMFILFLSMFVYQTANEEFLEPTGKEIIGGDTTEALQSTDASGVSLPFAPITASLPFITAGTIKKVERVPIEEFQLPSPPPKEATTSITTDTPLAEDEIELNPEIPTTVTNSFAIIVEKGVDIQPPPAQQPLPIPSDTVLEPRPLVPEEKIHAPQTADPMLNIYTLSKEAIKKNDLGPFATIDLIPDKTIRIILTGDLLFSLGHSSLSSSAKNSLYTLATVLKDTPYMINVVGHTDNIPMVSSRYRSNWELSVARASVVARFLIDEIGMNPNQFIVSGYASYRPVVANTSADNRAKNRRVEIIISKRLPKPLSANLEGLN